MSKSINELVREAHLNACDKGWHDENRSFAEVIALCHSELSEALEEARDGMPMGEIYFTDESEKPCGIPVELADCIIRIFDCCGKYDINLEQAINIKMQYNRSRPHRHGKVF